jgi:hypothetical protein
VQTVLVFSLQWRKDWHNVRPTGPRDASFSPYHDEDRISDFLDGGVQRFSTNAAIVFVVHVGLVFALSGSFIVPDLKPPPPPEPITVEIVTFDPVQEPEPEPEPIVIEPQITSKPPVAVPAPRPSPKPQPRPEPVPVPRPTPPPEPIPEPEVEPERVVTPPPPEILVQPDPEPEPEPEPEPLDPIDPEPLPDLDPLPEPEPEQIIEFFEPIPEPIVEPLPENLPEVPLQPLPEQLIEPTPDPSVEIFEPEAVVEPDPLSITPEVPATPGIIDADPLPEIVEAEPLPPEIIIEPDPEPVAPEPVVPDPILIEPEVTPEPEPEIIPTAPTVLASPDAPETREEEARAVPQEQSDPFLELLKKDSQSSLSDPVITPPAGGGNKGPISQGGDIAAPPGGGTQIGRTNPGAGGWTLAPQPSGGNKAFEGINLDIRCREEGRTHLDCPEYLLTNKGRDRTGRESFEGMAGTGADRGERISGSRAIPSRSALGVNIGDNSVNSGGPSTSVLDFQDTNFDREFVNKPLDLGPRPKGLFDLFTPSEPPPKVNDWGLSAPPPADEETNDDSIDWILDKLPDE